MIIASIPSPSSGVIELGPLPLRAYGFLIALGVLAAVAIAQRRWDAKGGGPEDFTTIAMWAVPAGLVGGRLYHVVTDNQKFRGNWIEALYIWNGGLGIWGAVAGGVLGGLWVARREGLEILPMLDAVAPALAVAQAIGRFGNYFNQELFGRPTDLPWGLEIDVNHRPSDYLDFETFHPTFLYESLWNLALAGFLIFVGQRLLRDFSPGRLFGLYMIGYTLGRLWIELVRVDPANKILGQRINVWTSLIIMFAGAVIVWSGRPSRESDGSIDKEVASSDNSQQ